MNLGVKIWTSVLYLVKSSNIWCLDKKLYTFGGYSWASPPTWGSNTCHIACSINFSQVHIWAGGYDQGEVTQA